MAATNNSNEATIDDLASANANVIFDSETYVQSTGSAKVALNTNNNQAATKAAQLHDETLNNVATCALQQIVATKSAPQSVANLTGKVLFWQQIENRGATHLIASAQYVAKSEPSSGQQARYKRESFTMQIGRRAPPTTTGNNSDEFDSKTSEQQRMRTIRHQIWLYELPNTSGNNESSGGVSSCAQMARGGDLKSVKRRLIAELAGQQQLAGAAGQGCDDKPSADGCSVELDAESFVAAHNLTGENSLEGGCLIVFADLAAAKQNLATRVGDNNELVAIGHCAVGRSLPMPVPEPEDAPVGGDAFGNNNATTNERRKQVSGAVQPVLVDLLASSGPDTRV